MTKKYSDHTTSVIQRVCQEIATQIEDTLINRLSGENVYGRRARCICREIDAIVDFIKDDAIDEVPVGGFMQVLVPNVLVLKCMIKKQSEGVLRYDGAKGEITRNLAQVHNSMIQRVTSEDESSVVNDNDRYIRIVRALIRDGDDDKTIGMAVRTLLKE